MGAGRGVGHGMSQTILTVLQYYGAGAATLAALIVSLKANALANALILLIGILVAYPAGYAIWLAMLNKSMTTRKLSDRWEMSIDSKPERASLPELCRHLASSCGLSPRTGPSIRSTLWPARALPSMLLARSIIIST